MQEFLIIPARITIMIPVLATLVAGWALTARAQGGIPDGVPSFVVDYAPVVYLHSEDKYWPSDISAQLTNTEPKVNFEPVANAPNPLTLDNLAELNDFGGENVFLTSKIKPDANPPYLKGVLPNADGETQGAISCAIVTNDHGDGTVDAFYFYFYAFDFGGVYVGQNIGNHVGDWEHNMIRFVDGKPSAVWYSQHSNGQAFEYGTVMKLDGGDRVSRPGFVEELELTDVCTAAYRLQRQWLTRQLRHQRHSCLRHSEREPALRSDRRPHGRRSLLGPYAVCVLVFIQQDQQGFHILWFRVRSPSTSSNFFSLTVTSESVNWLSFLGHWGDEKYSQDDPIQDCVFGIDALCKYTGGPTGPIDKQLDREEVCPDNGILCIVRKILVQRSD